ncbi:MAG: excinuclease ABC subunit UvrC [Clostridiales bacterium]|nr:excinuclease ABC subunit UvrC [Clostridiales bacterium]
MDAVFNIQEELKKLPEKPGVYLMHNALGEIIYIGKAVKLKNRVRQYFQSNRNKTSKIKEMVSNIAWFEYIITDSEVEALVLECNLIKEHRPRYNTMLKDGKGYPYIRVTVNETYPRVMMAHEMKKDKTHYFGPYPSSAAVKDTLDLIYRIFRIRTCSKNLPKEEGKGRPCLNYHMKRCLAPCQGYTTPEQYRQQIDQVIQFLNGKYDGVKKFLEQNMYRASEQMEFEEAAYYRDLIKSVQMIAQKQKLTNRSMEDQDIIAMALSGEEAVVQVFFMRDGKMIGREHFHLRVASDDSYVQILTSFIKQFYAGTPFIPKEILLQEEIEEKELIMEWLTEKRGKKVSILIPKKGEKEHLIELAKKNAQMVLEQDREKIQREEQRTMGALEQIEQWIGVEKIRRVEAYDISNTNGLESVGSMVVYEDGKPRRNDYRKFRIQSVKGPDDYASMREVLTRRFSHGLEEIHQRKQAGSFTKFPDLIMMDGGKGQVNVALEVLEELELNIPVCGMVKDDHHRTRGLYFHNQEIPIDTHSEGFHLITRIQDEAHRFAIEYHRSLRGKAVLHSVLDDIPGIGPKRRRTLMKHFGDLEKIKIASLEELLCVEGMTKAAANEVFRFFHTE